VPLRLCEDDAKASALLSGCEGFASVPLSEDEQRILSEIEQQFYADDPGFARQVGSTTLYSHAFRNLKWASFGFVVGLVFLVATLSTSFWISFGGFLVMLASAFIFERNARKMGRAGLEQMTRTMRAAGLRDYFGGASKKMRDRFRKEDE
jgi:hypothetical protein